MTSFDEWLRRLKLAQKGPLVLPVATRGLLWSEPIEIEGDWTGATLVGTIRTHPDAPTALATMTISGPVVAGGVSTWTASLAAGSGANSTGVLPGDDDLDGAVDLPFSFLITPSGGSQQLLVGGVLTVLGKV